MSAALDEDQFVKKSNTFPKRIAVGTVVRGVGAALARHGGEPLVLEVQDIAQESPHGTELAHIAQRFAAFHAFEVQVVASSSGHRFSPIKKMSKYDEYITKIGREVFRCFSMLMPAPGPAGRPVDPGTSRWP